ncbi:unnamed protein product [Blumeria hordei]|uniref:Uncharacterized protein n=2 Tax=Blumeria hordei TaxID=2867405 RepID=A0A383UUP7_BLUHO|nr:hypothetical protein BGHDH14_bgh06325 [Blumeria hordei DH14]SZF03509.1 unnamed protein product [Blumeria hordei]
MTSNSNGPAIFFDSHPEEQDGYLKSWLTVIRTNLAIAATGIVERFQQPGELRLKWISHDGNVGFKDYPLREYEQAHKEFYAVLTLPEVRRAMILGFPHQNPYILINGKNPWVERFQREDNHKEKLVKEQKARIAMAAVRGGEYLDIEGLVRGTEIEEQKRIEKEREIEDKKIEEAIMRRQGTTKEKYADEEEGLLSGQRV